MKLDRRLTCCKGLLLWPNCTRHPNQKKTDHSLSRLAEARMAQATSRCFARSYHDGGRICKMLARWILVCPGVEGFYYGARRLYRVPSHLCCHLPPAHVSRSWGRFGKRLLLDKIFPTSPGTAADVGCSRHLTTYCCCYWYCYFSIYC